jgi:alpha-L-rhamnosidase
VFQLTPPVEVYKIKPVKVEAIENGHYIIDFGQEITGQFEIRAKGMNGQKIDIRCGEEMDDSGQGVRYDMRCNCRYRESWILSGEDDVLEQYDYKAFRYVEVTAPESVVEEDSFSAWVRHYPFDEEKCRFVSSGKVLNDIWAICKNGVKYGSQEGYLDCPTREKGQYLGDAVITALSHIYLTGDLRLYKKAVRDFSLSANICPGLMAVAPGSYMQEIADYSLQWPQMLLDYYRHSGDYDFLIEMYPTVEGVIKYFKKYERTDGLLENVKGKWNLVDWPQNMRDGYDFDLSQPVGYGCHNVVNAFYLGAVKTVNQIRDILKTSYTDEFPALHDAFIKTFYDEDTRLFVDSNSSSHSALHTNIIPLFYGLVPDEAKENIVDLIRCKRLCCGVYIAYYLLKGLAGIGEYELVYDLIMSEDERSWVNMLREGATTCFEAWGKEQKQNTSLCHPWASAPIPVLVEDIIGLKPGKPGWEAVSFTPHIPVKLRQLLLKITVKTGEIYVESRDGKHSIRITK